MDLLLWRHAEAHDAVAGGTDRARTLTPKGIRQAERVGQWLSGHLPADARVYCSPAVRTVQTAEALRRPFQLRPVLAPGGSPLDLRALVAWPTWEGTTLVVGHQPTLGQVVAQLLGLPSGDCSVKKGAVWWLRHRVRDGEAQTVLVAMHNPDLG